MHTISIYIDLQTQSHRVAYKILQTRSHRVAYKNRVERSANTNTNTQSCIQNTHTKVLKTNIELHTNKELHTKNISLTNIEIISSNKHKHNGHYLI